MVTRSTNFSSDSENGLICFSTQLHSSTNEIEASCRIDIAEAWNAVYAQFSRNF